MPKVKTKKKPLQQEQGQKIQPRGIVSEQRTAILSMILFKHIGLILMDLNI